MTIKPDTSDTRIESIVSIPAPADLQASLPLSDDTAQQIVQHRARIADILHGRDNRLLVVVGPCSIHDPDAAREYAHKLVELRQRHADTLEVVMRVYFEKPRSTVGWKGLINDPLLDNSCDISKGLRLARALLVDIANLGLPAGCEFLDAATGQYYADLVSWGAIGARTTESQIHRELASGLSCPVGFKNGTSGNINIAIDAMRAAAWSHAFLSPDTAGKLSLYTTKGNSDSHLILRGGHEPNFDTRSVTAAIDAQQAVDIERRVVIDCSHANSHKDFREQSTVVQSVLSRLPQELNQIGGLMIESNLVEGKQSLQDGVALTRGQSITDGCIGWPETEDLIDQLAATMKRCQA